MRKYYIVYKYPEVYSENGSMEPCYIAESLEEAEKQIIDTKHAVIHIVNEHFKDIELAIPYYNGRIELWYFAAKK